MHHYARKNKTTGWNASRPSSDSHKNWISRNQRGDQILHLQRTVGNQAVQTLLTGSGSDRKPGLRASAFARLIQRHAAARISEGEPRTAAAPSTPFRIALYGRGRPKVKTGWIDSIWTYVAYMDQGMIRVARHVSSSDPTRRIGTIPWITNNPGNLTVASAGLAATEPGRQGASPTPFAATPTTRMRYAIFSSSVRGESAILPVLKRINEGNGGKLSLREALAIYYSGKGPRDRQYVADIRTFMIEEMEVQRPDLTPAQIAQAADEILNRQVSSFPDSTEAFEFVLYGLEKKEGAFAPPGVEYSCDGGFTPTDRRSGYTGEQMQAIERFEGAYETRLREILEC